MRYLTIFQIGSSGDIEVIKDNPPVSKEEREKILQYMRAGRIVVRTTSKYADRIDPERDEAVPHYLVTDGDWLWDAASEYYLEKHEVAPLGDFVAHVRKANYVAPEVAQSTLEEAVQFVKSGSIPEPIRTR